MESLVNQLFKKRFTNKRILIFGNSGFVGSWLSLSLKLFGAKILGISLQMSNVNYLSNTSDFKKNIKTINCDLKNLNKIKSDIVKFKPEIVVHLASQPIVKIGFSNPSETYETNVLGTIKILEIVRKISSIKKILIFTSDKVYSNNNKMLTEKSALGGLDPYSASKSAQDIIAQSYGFSFFSKTKMIILRSGNIIGGGDWAKNRLIPDIVRSYLSKSVLKVRSFNSTRPWIHIFDVINAILLLLFKSNFKNKQNLIFNLSPKKTKQISVKKIVHLIQNTTAIKKIRIKKIKNNLKEKKYLHISSKKALTDLNWKTNLDLSESLKLTIDFYLLSKNKIYDEAINQLKKYFLKNNK
ncbi:CDP-glucose 4,6-dehydratase [Candidatus Pelagibacter sp.]|jgi:CDP-glucose 4,6-dehydratase|nr:CDP-glucose 4,6-dehydratase [Candidatus Pelagibacter sp.]